MGSVGANGICGSEWDLRERVGSVSSTPTRSRAPPHVWGDEPGPVRGGHPGAGPPPPAPCGADGVPGFAAWLRGGTEIREQRGSPRAPTLRARGGEAARRRAHPGGVRTQVRRRAAARRVRRPLVRRGGTSRSEGLRIWKGLAGILGGFSRKGTTGWPIELARGIGV